MQPIDAERTAVPFAEMLGGSPNKSGARVVAGSLEIDEILNVAQSIFVPMGQEPSKWAGSDEFREFAERYGRSDKCFGMGGPDGLTLETPFGKRSSLIRLDHDIKHPALGSGLLGTLRLPVFESLEASTRTCVWLNFLGLSQWTGAPVHGTWHPQEIRKDEFSPSYGAFIPNSLYSDGLATNLALWNLMLARWARMTVWPQLQDDTMHNILTARLGEIDAGAKNEIGDRISIPVKPLGAEFSNIYRATTFRVESPHGHIDIRIGDKHPRVDALLCHHNAAQWAYITAWNPGSQPVSAETNAAAHAELIDLVVKRLFPFYEGVGIPDNPGWQPERSIWIAGISRQEAMEIGGRFGQNAIVVGEIDGAAELLFCND